MRLDSILRPTASNFSMRKIAALLIGLAALAAFAAPASAQNLARAALSTPDASHFPTLSAYLTVTDAQGAFVPDLSPADLTLAEDGQNVTVTSLEEVHPGVRFFVVINPGPSLGLRDAEGITRYDRIAQALIAWAGSGEANPADRFALITGGDSNTTLYTNTKDWLTAFQAYHPNLRNPVGSLDSLSLALNLAVASPERPGMASEVLLVASPPDEKSIASLNEMAQSARQAGVPVHVWLAAGPGGMGSPGTQALQGLAASTGGDFFFFTGAEAIPDPGAYLTALGSVYRLTYTTTIRQGGQHTLSVQVRHGAIELASVSQDFKLDVQPPNPIFLSPPTEIVRSAPAGSHDPLRALEPTKYPLRVLVEFPDGHPRPLKTLRLYAGGQLLAEAASPPYDTILWDLNGYTHNQQVVLRLEAEDQLGLKKDSLELPIQITVQLPPRTLQSMLRSNLAGLAAVGIFLSGALMVFAILRSTRRRYQLSGSRRNARKDPVTQPVPIQADMKPAHTGWSERLTRVRRTAAGPPHARLVRLKANNEPESGRPILISSRETTFGRDPNLASVVIEAPGVDALHARLTRRPDGVFVLRDANSVAGTWVNYAPVSVQGTPLEHGDLIHIGRVAFRFLLENPQRVRKPTITPYNEGL